MLGIRRPDLVLQAIKSALEKTPDLRVGQFLENAVTWYNQVPGDHARYMDSTGKTDMFYVEDVELANIINMFLLSLQCPHCGGEGGKHFLDCRVWDCPGCGGRFGRHYFACPDQEEE